LIILIKEVKKNWRIGMSLLDNYRRNYHKISEDLSKLHSNRAKESTKIASEKKKIATAQQALSRTSSESTAKSKQRQITSYQKNVASAEKKIADIDKNIATKEKKKVDEQKKITKEEIKDNNKKQRESEKKQRDQNNRMNSFSQTLSTHRLKHKETEEKLKELSQLPEKINVIFFAANPLDQKQLRLDEEVREITNTIRASKHRDSVNLISCWAVRPLDLLQAINEHEPTIIHFSGHGAANSDLVFQDDNGDARIVTKDAIAHTINTSPSEIRHIFFNTCHSKEQAVNIVNYIDSAIGMNESIGDAAARVFSAAFYSAIGFGLSVGKAFNQGKAAMMLENIPQDNIPELFIRDGLSEDDIVIVKP